MNVGDHFRMVIHHTINRAYGKLIPLIGGNDRMKFKIAGSIVSSGLVNFNIFTEQK
jgi:hypothetical protein